jgi:dihydrofolate reductase
VHSFVNELTRRVGTHLYGRRLYEVMVAWEHPEGELFEAPHMREFAAVWQNADKIVFSRTLEGVSTARTRLEREFDPEAIGALKTSADHDLAVGGAALAAQAFEAGLVDECHLFVSPIIVGGGTRCLPGGVRLELELLDERRFRGGMVYLRYSATGRAPRRSPR